MKRAWRSANILPSGGSLTLLGIATTTGESVFTRHVSPQIATALLTR